MKTPEQILDEVAAENMIDIQTMVTTEEIIVIAMRRFAKLYHKNEVEKLHIQNISNAKRTICHCSEPKFIENIQGDLICQNCGKP